MSQDNPNEEFPLFHLRPSDNKPWSYKKLKKQCARDNKLPQRLLWINLNRLLW